MSAPSPFDNLPPEIVGPLADKFAALYAAGIKAGYDLGDRDATARWQRRYADLIEQMVGAESDDDRIDDEVLEAVAGLTRRAGGPPVAAWHRHHWVRPRARPRYAS